MADARLSGKTVCIVDDDALVRKNISIQLSQHAIRVLEATDGPALSGLIDRYKIDCILMDINLIDENGLLVQAQLRDRFIDVPPVIILSANDNQRTIIKAFRTGVSDYLIKNGLKIEELLETLRSAMERREKDQAVRGELDHLKRRSLLDEGTGLYRREAIDEVLAGLMKAPVQLRKAFAIVLIRIDQYDWVTERAGQVAARDVVRAFTARLRDSVRGMDICGRYDAKTFIYAVDTGVSRNKIEGLVARLDTALRFNLDLDVMSLGISASFGVAFYPEDAADPVALTRFAETELGDPGRGAHGSNGSAPFGEATTQGGEVRVGERRSVKRHRVFKQGKIIVDGGKTVLDCTVRDLSETGARLRLSGMLVVPSNFDLLVVGSGSSRPVHRVWQRSNELGVAFVTPVPALQ